MRQEDQQAEPILRVSHVSRRFPVGAGLWGRPRGYVHALDDVSLTLNRGETLGLVGESGCGKSTLARLLVALDHPSEGEIRYHGEGAGRLGAAALRERRKRVQMVFQDPLASLNPRMTARASIAEPLGNFTDKPAKEIDDRVAVLAAAVGLAPHVIDRYPHELSGGQCQRIGIARAIAADPEILIADEPVSALDVSIRAQILNLLLETKRRMGLSMVFVSHDLSIVAHIADRVAVMYLGRIVETGPVSEVFGNPRHPYTRMLVGSVPHPLPSARGRRAEIAGELPSPINPPEGCHFRARCAHAQTPLCRDRVPRLESLGPVEVACLRVRDIGLPAGTQT